MLDLHCHLLFDVDDGAPDLETAVEMARLLGAAGFDRIAASPHFGGGPAGHVPAELASQRRQILQARLLQDNIAVTLLPNAEHHVTPSFLLSSLRGRVSLSAGRATGTW